jgi:hypothetical protein
MSALTPFMTNNTELATGRLRSRAMLFKRDGFEFFHAIGVDVETAPSESPAG